jgi:hypothetical protein
VLSKNGETWELAVYQDEEGNGPGYLAQVGHELTFTEKV